MRRINYFLVPSTSMVFERELAILFAHAIRDLSRVEDEETRLAHFPSDADNFANNQLQFCD
jgi:hypothetical protein